ncbi:MAG: hypothetical protein U5L76_04265 [Patescibacteria group bacterium]|nr:hypothetical protein [Patescibacteria group bacterium]
MSEEKIKKLAAHEIGWWRAHHRKDKKEFLDHMVKLYIIQFGIKEQKACEAVKWKIEAAD